MQLKEGGRIPYFLQAGVNQDWLQRRAKIRQTPFPSFPRSGPND